MMAKKIFERVRDVLTLIIVVATIMSGIVTFGWCKLALPEVDKRISEKQQPIIDALEFQNFLMMETMPDTAVIQAEQKYTASKRGIGR
jgi:cytochrome c biogenesis protein CcdA